MRSTDRRKGRELRGRTVEGAAQPFSGVQQGGAGDGGAEHVKARAIDVTTNGSTVTVSGAVRSVSEHDRALRLARETAGVTQVIDHLTVETK